MVTPVKIAGCSFKDYLSDYIVEGEIGSIARTSQTAGCFIVVGLLCIRSMGAVPFSCF
jgi:hypothetical protein